MRFARVATTHNQYEPSLDQLVEKADLDVLQLDYLWPQHYPPEQTYAVGLLQQMRTLHKTLYLDPNLHLISNAGGGNSLGCIEELANFLCEHGDGDLPITAIRGDNVLPCLEELASAGIDLRDTKTGISVQELTQPLIAAQVELGAGPLATAWDEGSRLVIAGCYDLAAPAIAATVSAQQWHWQQTDALSQLAVASQLSETILEVDANRNLTIQAHPGKSLNPQRLENELLRLATAGGLIRQADVSCQVREFDLQSTASGTYRLAGITGEPTLGEWQLRLSYQSGYCAEAVLACHGEKSVGEKATEQLHELLAVDESTRHSISIQLLPSTTVGRAGLIYACCQSQQQDTCVKFVDALTNFPWHAKNPNCRWVGCSPSWKPAISQLNCLVPCDAIAVSVDTRSAKEWS